MRKFERNTPALFSAALDHLAEQKTVLNKTQFKALQMMLGITYDGCVVPYSSYRGMLNIPASRYTDWLHDLLASGGVFAILVNEVVLDVLGGSRLTRNDIDEFQQGISFPGSKLTKTFFTDRIVKKRGKPIKAFASETMCAVTVLCFLFVCVFGDSATFARQARLCELAREALEILLAGDLAVRLANRLDVCLEELQTILVALYPWCLVPKAHLMRHIKDALEYHRVNMACMGGREAAPPHEGVRPLRVQYVSDHNPRANSQKQLERHGGPHVFLAHGA